MQPSPQPRIPASELRPGRHWYLAAVGVAVVLFVLGVSVGVYRFAKAIDAVDHGDPYANGDTITLRLAPESQKTIWVKYPGPSPGPECDITGPGTPRLTEPGADVFLTREETWTPLSTIEVSQAGDHAITCSSHALSRYALGEAGGLAALAGWLVLAMALPALGIGVGAAIILATAVRRRRHRRRLITECYGCDGDQAPHLDLFAGAGPDAR
ncbi:hypothetical protein [Streptomyces sp. NPDC055099]